MRNLKSFLTAPSSTYECGLHQWWWISRVKEEVAVAEVKLSIILSGSVYPYFREQPVVEWEHGESRTWGIVERWCLVYWRCLLFMMLFIPIPYKYITPEEYSVSAPPDTPARDDTVIRKLSQFWPDGPGNFYTVNNHVYLLSREIRSQSVEVSGFCDGVNPFWAQIWRNHSRWSSNLSCFTRNFAPFEYFSSILDI